MTQIGRDLFVGSIEVHGGGGIPGGTLWDGLGGGPGGAILLEAPLLLIHSGGSIGANGGGGSCTDGSGGPGDLSGNDNGAICVSPNGSGGDGGTAAKAAEFGAASGSGAGGGGGGGVGRARVNTRGGSFDKIGTFSPQPSVGEVGVR